MKTVGTEACLVPGKHAIHEFAAHVYDAPQVVSPALVHAFVRVDGRVLAATTELALVRALWLSEKVVAVLLTVVSRLG